MSVQKRWLLVVTGMVLLLLAACGPLPTATVAEPAQPEVIVVSPTPEPATQTPVVVVVTSTTDANAPAEEQPAEEEPAAEQPEETEEPAAAPSDQMGFPGNPVTSNSQWNVAIEEFENMDFALVPVGCFQMGDNDASATFAEQPVHQICFDNPFWIGVYEVQNEEIEVRNFSVGAVRNWAGDDVPRTNITWVEAQNFCESIGARLPTEAEWEYAARGPDAVKWPFGDSFLPGFIVYAENATSPINGGSYDENASWVGALDMAGNVREWTHTNYKAYPYEDDDGRENGSPSGDKVVRGGSYQSGQDFVRAPYREFYNALGFTADLGFRCARDYTP